jgi:hypothetical protein
MYEPQKHHGHLGGSSGINVPTKDRRWTLGASGVLVVNLQIMSAS